jgi:hypothetical protein
MDLFRDWYVEWPQLRSVTAQCPGTRVWLHKLTVTGNEWLTFGCEVLTAFAVKNMKPCSPTEVYLSEYRTASIFRG